MIAVAPDSALKRVLEKFPDAREMGDGFTCRCPAHDDSHESLTIAQGNKGVVLRCHKGCDNRDVVEKVGLRLADLFDKKDGGKPKPGRKPGKSSLAGAIAAYKETLGTNETPQQWCYVDREGKPYQYILRFNINGKKEIRPVSVVDGRYLLKHHPCNRHVFDVVGVLSSTKPLVAEGEKCAEKLSAMFECTATTWIGGARGVAKTDWTSFNGKDRVVIFVDNDQPGRDATDNVAKELARLPEPPKEVVAVEFPELPEGGDVYDWLVDCEGFGKSNEEIAALLMERIRFGRRIDLMAVAAKEVDEQQKDDRPTIIIDVDEERVVNESIAALSRHPNLYQRGGNLVHPIRDAQPPRGLIQSAPQLRMEPVGEPRVREALATVAKLVVIKKDSEGEPVETPVHPPQFAVKAVLARGQWPGVRPLAGIRETPMLRHDGTIADQPGYDEATGLYLEMSRDWLKVSDRPTIAEAKAAADCLRKIVVDFPFLGEEHKVAWLAAAITPLARFAFHGPAPLLTCDANTRGSGKSFLVDIIGHIAFGADMDRCTVPSNDEEFRKRITSFAIIAQPAVLLDNLDKQLNSSAFDAALTASSWSDRILGGNKTFSGPLDTLWFLTANNVSMNPDSVRRSLYCRLESKIERPEDRTVFTDPNLRLSIRKQRPQLVHAALTILRHYVVAGRPDVAKSSFGSFEGWSGLVRNAVMLATDIDPLASRSVLKESVDLETVSLGRLMRLWLAVAPDGSRVADMLELVRPKPGQDMRTTTQQNLAHAITEVHQGHDGGLPTPKGLGNKLRRLRHRVVGGLMLHCIENDKEGHLWKVVNPNDASVSGSTGSEGV